MGLTGLQKRRVNKSERNDATEVHSRVREYPFDMFEGGVLVEHVCGGVHASSLVSKSNQHFQYISVASVAYRVSQSLDQSDILRIPAT